MTPTSDNGAKFWPSGLASFSPATPAPLSLPFWWGLQESSHPLAKEEGQVKNTGSRFGTEINQLLLTLM